MQCSAVEGRVVDCSAFKCISVQCIYSVLHMQCTPEKYGAVYCSTVYCSAVLYFKVQCVVQCIAVQCCILKYSAVF